MSSLLIAIVNSLGRSSLLHFRLRTLLYRAVGMDVALRSRIWPGCAFASNEVTIGWRTSVNYGCYFDNLRAPVTIGNRVGVGHQVQFITTNHATDNPLCRAGATSYDPIHIGDGAFIGAGATILGGVTIGAGAVIAAGAVVTKDCEPHTLYAGVPAVAVRSLSTAEPLAHPGR